MKKDKIFIQIAAYRDPLLVSTVKDCIEKAKYPENLVFCVAWQHTADETIDEIKNLPNVKIIDIDYQQILFFLYHYHAVLRPVVSLLVALRNSGCTQCDSAEAVAPSRNRLVMRLEERHARTEFHLNAKNS